MTSRTDLFQFGMERGETLNKLAEKYLGD